MRGPAKPERSTVQMPQFPFRPGREAYSRQTRRHLVIALAAAILGIVGFAVFAASRSATPSGRAVPIPAADRLASPALLRAAGRIGFHPMSALSAGQVEGEQVVSAQGSSASGLLAVGVPAPGFTLKTPEGVPVTLAGLRGKAVLLEFFATWCPHCAAEAPHLKALYRSFPGGKVAFVGVNVDSEDAASVLAYHIYYGLPFPAVLDPGTRQGSFHSAGSRGPVSAAYGVSVFPAFYVLDGTGRVVWRGAGEQSDATLRAGLQRALADKGAPVAGTTGASGCTAACSSP